MSMTDAIDASVITASSIELPYSAELARQFGAVCLDSSAYRHFCDGPIIHEYLGADWIVRLIE